MTAEELDAAKIARFRTRVIDDLAASAAAVLIRLGDRLGLYRAMADGKAVTSAQLAVRTGLAERYLREWMHAQAAGGWLTYDPATDTFTLPAEHAVVIADRDASTDMLGAFDWIPGLWADADALEQAFRTGAGIGWHQHDERLYAGTERFFGAGYRINLIASWLPALDGVLERLTAGARIADVGCGYGAATILLARAFPDSQLVGYDYHEASVATARTRAAEAGLTNLRFDVGTAEDFDGTFDLICLFDCLHDMGDPLAALTHIRGALADGATLMLVEPASHDRAQDNHRSPLGRLFYAISTMICVPGSLAQAGGQGTGNQLGPARLTSLMESAGFGRVRLAVVSPVNLVFEARR
jgi:2-polyprenyl-3-methyl-5-hydroxy-6-metoxy-1,4-benzoquinol methylase